jgi:hypothetical protein
VQEGGDDELDYNLVINDLEIFLYIMWGGIRNGGIRNGGVRNGGVRNGSRNYVHSVINNISYKTS